MTQKHNVTKPGLDPVDTVAWQRWLQPLQGAMAGLQAPLDRKMIEAELEAYAKKKWHIKPYPAFNLLSGSS